uniref:Uncharacterized protein n=1 Tax=uncultured bacterium IN-11 TaxID=1805589 RepID=A0A142BW95_9BACT|nr:hypothetical protein [uncultured bacterium IN-11]
MSGIAEGLGKVAKGLGDMFINLSSEFPALLDVIQYLSAAGGILIGGSAVFTLIRKGRRGAGGEVSLGGIGIQMIAAASLVELSLWMKVFSSTFWMNGDNLDINQFVVSGGGGDYSKQALAAALGIMFIAGYITLARAYFMLARFGREQNDSSRSNLLGSIAARILAGSALVSILRISEAFQNSTGFQIIG